MKQEELFTNQEPRIKSNPFEAENDYDRILVCYYYCFKQSPEGQIVLSDLEDRFYRRTFIPDIRSVQLDPTYLAIQVGLREVVTFILSKVEEYELMQRSR